jgi:uncharacterized protein (TIGR00725 family)
LQKRIGVIGAAECSADITALAEEVGYRIAKKEGILITGGLSGVMEAACKGAKAAGGLTVGILPGFDAYEANPFVDIPIVTGLSHARNVIVVRSAEGIVAIAGGYGTLSEIAIALKIGRPIVGIDTWEIAPQIVQARGAKEAVEKIFDAIGP